MRSGATISHNKLMQTATPAVISGVIIRDFLEATGVLGVPDHLTVFSAGVYNRHTGQMTTCDTSGFFTDVGADVGEEITFSGETVKISRYVVVHHDSAT